MEEDTFTPSKIALGEKMNNRSKTIALVVLTTIMMLFSTRTVLAQQQPMVTFRLDDGLTSQYEYARPILSKYNFPAVEYVFTDPPEEGNWISYMNWAQIEELHNVYGWEIGGHTKSHPDLTRLTNSRLTAELKESKTILENHGFSVKSFASPFGLYNNKVLSYIAKFYESHSSAWPYDFNSYPFNDYEIAVQEVRGSTSVETIKSWIDEAAANKKWLVLLFHEIVESNPTEYEYSKNNFESVVDYVKTKNIPVVTITEALKILNPNLVLNPSLESTIGGWADNWSRTNTSHIILDTNNNGCSPNPKNSLKFTGGSSTYRVSTKNFININPNKTYLLKAYFNCQNFTRGGVDIFFDEYDSGGGLLTRKWQTGIGSKYVGSKPVIYTPSANATKLLVWIEVAAGSSLTCYVDNIVLADTKENIEPNRNPVLAKPIPDQSFNEDTTLINAFDLDYYFSDPDGDLLTYSYSGATNVIVTINPDGTVNFSASLNWHGVENIVFSASDGSLTAQDTIIITVNPINDAPIITSTPVVEAIRDTSYIYDVDATDVDGDTLTYSSPTHPTGMTIDATTGKISWIPTGDQVGNQQVTVEVSDGLLTATQSWTITVNQISSNLILNPSFESTTSGWADYWLRTDTSHIMVDTNNNGTSSNPVNSLKLVGGTNTYKVYTKDFIGVNPTKTYLLKVYFNCQNFTRGGVDVFIDEYNSEGGWLKWKWQTGIWSNYVGEKAVTYTPSLNAGKLLIWIEAVSGSDLTCNLDNIALTESP